MGPENRWWRYSRTKIILSLFIPIITLISLVFLSFYLSPQAAFSDTLQKKIQEKINDKAITSALGIPLYDTGKVNSYYQSTRFKASWVNDPNENFNVNILSIFLNLAEEDGLIIRDYHRNQIKQFIPRIRRWISHQQADSLAGFDILVTDACLDYVIDISTGQLYSSQLNINRYENINSLDLYNNLKNAIELRRLQTWFRKLPPGNCKYEELKESLDAYTKICDHQGFGEELK